MTTITRNSFGKISGREILRYTLSDDALSVSVMPYGASVQRIVYRGRDMILSLPEAELYPKFSAGCIGAVVGRYAGRIADGRFTLDGREYRLSRNQGGNHLHGGRHGFHTKRWSGGIAEDADGGVKFTLLSPDGDEGYPGNLRVSVTYRLTDGDCLAIAYEASCDRDTVLNLTNHCYFNPNGVDNSPPALRRHDESDNRDIEMTIFADRVVELDREIPTGRLLPVEGTAFDFRALRRLADGADASFRGYDHTLLFSPHAPEQPVASARGMKSGVRIDCFTDQPAVQLFTMGNPGSLFAFETQHLPDSPNHPDFPSTVLKAGEVFRSETRYRFTQE